MTCINTSLCPPSLVRFHAVVPGRLLHVRLSHPNNTQHIDILNCYQHVLGKGEDQVLETMEHKRLSLLTKLSGTLAGLPSRNHVLVCGDLNMNVEPLDRLVGPSCGQTSPSWCPSHDPMALIELYDLCVLNTWSHSMAFTSSGPQGGRVLVDFVMARSVQVAPMSRCVRFLHDHPHKSLNPSCHCPLLVPWSLGWAPWNTQPIIQARRGSV